MTDPLTGSATARRPFVRFVEATAGFEPAHRGFADRVARSGRAVHPHDAGHVDDALLTGTATEDRAMEKRTEERPTTREVLKAAGWALAITVTTVREGERPHWCRFRALRHDATCSVMLRAQDMIRAELAATPEADTDDDE